MDPEHSALPQPPAVPAPQRSSQKPVSAHLLPSPMTSLTEPAAPNSIDVNRGASEPAAQYPSLDAAVAQAQPLVPTLSNLLALQVTPGKIGGGAATPLQGFSPSLAGFGGDQPIPSVSAPAIAMNSAISPASDLTTLSPAPLPFEGAAPLAAAPVSPAVLEEVADGQVADERVADERVADERVADERVADGLGEAIAQGDGADPQTSGDRPAPDPTQASATDPESDPESESEPDLDLDRAPDSPSPVPGSNLGLQVRIKREGDHLAIVFPKERQSANPNVAVDFIDSELWQSLQQRLSGSESFGEGTIPIHLYSQNCLLDTRQLQELDEALSRFDLKLTRLITYRRQTAVAAAMSGYSVDQSSELPELLSRSDSKGDGSQALAEPLYLQTTVRSGAEIRHPGSVVIVGDINPGSSVIADGDIVVWGRLRGLVHAGASGNKRSTIMALKMEPNQLRIADAVARVPAAQKGLVNPEVAHITPNGIRITPAANFSRG